MKKLAFATIAISAVLAAPIASAGCVGTGSFQTCTDNSGNSYNVQRIGSTTITHGYNSNTGSNWSQTSNTIGNTTFHNGTSSNGNSWNGTTQNIGDMQIHSGTDSRGNYYNKTCTQYGCN